MKTTRSFVLSSFLFSALLLQSVTAVAQKAKKPQKLDKRKYDIEIRETTTEGKKYEKDIFEFTAKEIISDYFEMKLKTPTMHYKTLKDSTFTDDGEEAKYYKLSASEKSAKGDENYQLELIINGKEITGTIKLMKGEAVKKSWEFEGSQNN